VTVCLLTALSVSIQKLTQFSRLSVQCIVASCPLTKIFLMNPLRWIVPFFSQLVDRKGLFASMCVCLCEAVVA